MSWLSTTYRRRAAITVDNSAAGGTTLDAQGTIPKDWDDFWSVIDSSGNHLRITYADGVTGVSYDVQKSGGGAFDLANRDGVIMLDGVTVPNSAGMVLFWLYYDPDGTVADGSAVVTITSAKALYIERSRPLGRIYPYEPQIPGSQRPKVTIHKHADEQIKVWLEIGHALHRRWTTGGGLVKHEEPWWTSVAVESTAGADQTSMYDLTLARFVEHRNRVYVVHHVKAGTTATNYTIRPSVYTLLPYESTANQRLIGSIGLSVRDTRITT